MVCCYGDYIVPIKFIAEFIGVCHTQCGWKHKVHIPVATNNIHCSFTEKTLAPPPPAYVSIRCILINLDTTTILPDITQWAVLAIRNLCEGNTANQRLIASLERKGVENTQALLEFGCEVEIGDNGKIKVKQKEPG